ncbi:MAG: DegV family protein [Eubacteriales bacterium]|nr:DegV family protein [Eubacteriales bacterium]
MAIHIVTDSAADFHPSEAAALGISLVPLTVTFDGKEYKDAVELSHKEFFEKLIETDALPTTSQATPHQFETVYSELTANGDSVVVVTISSKLSGTYQSACIAAQDYEGKVFVVDSLSATVGERILIQTALDYVKSGMCAEEIAARLTEDREKVCVMALLDTLEYLKKGGRISSAVAFAGGILSIKPVIRVEEGAVVLAGKARGSKNGNNLLRKLIEEVGGIDFSRHLCIVYSGLNDDMLQKYIEDSEDLWNGQIDNLPIATIGAVIGTHIGPGAVGIAFFRK